MDTQIVRQTTVLPITELVIPEYQRDPATHNRRILRQIVENFKPHLFHNVRVSCRNGVYILYDGGTRRAAAMALGHDTMTCELSLGMTEYQEREAFALQGTASSTSVQDFIQFWALHGGGNERELRIAEIVEANGFRVTRRGESGVNVIRAVKSLYEADNVGLLDQTLGIIAECWPSEPRALDNRVIRGLSTGFLYRYRNYHINRERLVQNIKSRSFVEAHDLMTEFKRTSRNDAHGQVWGKTFVAMYNYRRRRIPNWNEV